MEAAILVKFGGQKNMKKTTGVTLDLRLHSGVPIVDVQGSWEPALTDALSEMIFALSSAGHFDIVVNVQRAALEGISALRSLTRSANAVRSHCGHLDIVGTAEQLEALISERVGGLFRLASSEEGAIGRIKRIPILSTGVRVTARPS